ncbi:MAG: virulence RhuM family protein [Bacteroidales bacterium]|nr:virulence RhuM family protein [Bacteroidales bacterium]
MENNVENEIVFYQAENAQRIEVKIENETVWLNRQQLSVLFGRDVKTIGKHINNAMKEELKYIPTVANFATVGVEGDRIVTRNIDYYNLDMILSIGYRVKSDKGILFRRWANEILKSVLYKGYAISRRVEQLEERMDMQDNTKIEIGLSTKNSYLCRLFFDYQQ